MSKFAKIVTLGSICVISLGGVAAADQMRKGHGDGSKRFEKMDANNDGVLSADEFSSKFTARFDKADTNSDGIITKEELIDRMIRRRFERRASKIIKRMDFNGDGKVSRDEIENRLRKRFALLDRNDDGKIDKSELQRNKMKRRGKRHMQKMKKKAKKELQ